MFGLEAVGERLLWEGALLLVKATLVMAGALAISRTLLRRDPAARHALWTGTMLVLLLLPVLSVAGMPGIGVPVSVSYGPSVEETVEATLAGSPLRETAPSLPPAASSPEFAAGSSSATEPPSASHGGEAHATDWPVTDGFAGGPADAQAVDAALASTAASPRGSWTRRATSALGLLWGIGLAVLLLSLGAGIRRARRLIRRARPVAGPDWETQAQATARRVGLRHPVPLRVADGLGSPMAGGVLKPVVLLPPEAEGWTADRREVVLLHELVHVRRRDPLRQIVDRLVVALYWFHPLVRRAASEAATAREEACDRRVVEMGAGPSRYAAHLVELTDRPMRAPVGLTGFHHPNLEARIMSILAPSDSSRRGASVVSILLALAWFGAVAVVTPVASQAPPPEPPSVPLPAVQVASPAPPSPTLPTPPVAPPAPPPADTLDLWGCEAPAVEGEGVRSWVQESEVQGRPTMLRTTSIDGYGLCLFSIGAVRLTEAGLRPGSMEPGSSAEIVVASPEGSQRLRIRADDGGQIEEAWFVNDDEQPHGPEVEAWRDALLAYLDAAVERGNILATSARLRGQVSRMNGERARLQGEVARARGEVARLAGERGRLAGEEARLRGEIGRLNGETARLRGQLYRTQDPEERRELEARIEAHAALVERRVAEIESEIEALDTEHRLARMDEAIEGMQADTARIMESFRVRIAGLEEDHEARTREIESEIEALDVEARVAEIDGRLPELRTRALAAIEAMGFGEGETP